MKERSSRCSGIWCHREPRRLALLVLAFGLVVAACSRTSTGVDVAGPAGSVPVTVETTEPPSPVDGPVSPVSVSPDVEGSFPEVVPDLRVDFTIIENCGPPHPGEVQALAEPPSIYLVDGVFYLSPVTWIGGPVLTVEDPEMLAVAEDLVEALASAPPTLSRPDAFTSDGTYFRIETGADATTWCAFALEVPGLAVVEPGAAEAAVLAERLLLGLGWLGGRWENPNGVPFEGTLALIPSSRPTPDRGAVALPPGVVIGSNRCIELDAGQQRAYLKAKASAERSGGTLWWTDGEVTTTVIPRWLLPGESCRTLVERFEGLANRRGTAEGS